MRMHILLLLVILFGTSFQAAANPQAQNTTRPSIGVTKHQQSSLAYSDHDRAKQWDLTNTEWQRYKTLMQGIRGSISPAMISPIEVLGIHAESKADRRKYAERWAQMLRDDTEQILAFQQAVIKANERLYSNQPLIDISKLKQRQSKITLNPGDRLLFFTTTTDCSTCDAQLSVLLSKTRLSAVKLDIFLLGTEGQDEAARQWAQTHNIPPELVRQHAITINHDKGTLTRLSQYQGKPPYLMLQSPDGTLPVSLGDLR